jgi:hypothetical protein
MHDRKITKAEIKETLHQPYFTVPSREDRFIFAKKAQDKYLKVIAEKNNNKITVIQFTGQGDPKRLWYEWNTTKKPTPSTYGCEKANMT